MERATLIAATILTTLVMYPYPYQGTAAETPLYIGGFFALSGDSRSWASGMYPAVILALEYINNSTDILNGYELTLKVVDTESNSGTAMRGLIELLASGEPVVGLIGSSNSHVSMALSETSKWWNLVQIACSNYNPDLSDKEVFPLYFRTIAPITAFIPGFMAIFEYYGWTRTAILYHHKDYELVVGSYECRERLVAENITVLAHDSFIDDPSDEIMKMKELDIRIIIGFMYSPEARKAFCEMRRQGMRSPKYVLITIQSGSDDWWREEDSDCTPDEILEAADEAIFTVFSYADNYDVSDNDFGVDYDEFHDHYHASLVSLGLPESMFAVGAFDSVFVMALALNSSLEKLADIGRDLSTFIYDAEMANIIHEEVQQTNIKGLTGPLQFDGNGDRIGLVQFKQIRGGSFLPFAVFRPIESELTLQNGWTQDEAPMDEIKRIIRPIVTSASLFFFSIITASAGIFLALTFMCFNIYNREKRIIKLSSPNINNMICVGGTMAYTSVIVNGIGLYNHDLSLNARLTVCQLSAWTLSLGFTIGFGALFAKTWRIHRIFTSKTTKRIVIHDWTLFIYVFILVLLDVLLLCLWTAIDPLTVRKTSLPAWVDTIQDALILPEIQECTSSKETIWLGLLCGYKGIILLFGCFLAWETRKVKYEALNDSHYIGFAVYCVLLLSIIGVGEVIFLSDNPTEGFGLNAACIIICTTSVLCVVFVPKVKQLRSTAVDTLAFTKHDNLETTATMPPSNHNHAYEGASTIHHTFRHERGTCEEVEAENKQLRQRLLGIEPPSKSTSVGKDIGDDTQRTNTPV